MGKDGGESPGALLPAQAGRTETARTRDRALPAGLAGDLAHCGAVKCFNSGGEEFSTCSAESDLPKSCAKRWSCMWTCARGRLRTAARRSGNLAIAARPTIAV